MDEHILFLTGKLAEPQLRAVLARMRPAFRYTVHPLGLKVAALMTADMIGRRLKDTFAADRILVPGRCRGDLDALSARLGVPVARGPDELKDLPEFFGGKAQAHDLSQHRVNIFAEITDAPRLGVAQILARAGQYREMGADVIDIGCLPSTDFPHLEAAVRALKQAGFAVSVDSLEAADLLRGGKAGADFLLSLDERTVGLVDEVAATPVLIPARHGDLGSLERAMAALRAKGRPFIADPILDPIHFGFTDSLVRYHEFRRRHPQAQMMLGVGNLTELTHADTAGMNALLLGVCSELDIGHILTTQVSGHACRAIKEADWARRIMWAAKSQQALPKHISPALMALHEPKPFPYEPAEIAALAGQITDPSYRIQVSAEGVHIFNRDGLHSATDPFELYPHLRVGDDGGHAFYLGVELARAQIAWQLGKRYCQDQALGWGCASQAEEAAVDLHTFKPAGSTLRKP